MAMPRPRLAANGVPQPISSAAFCKACAQSPSARVSWGMNSSPNLGRFRRRISSGSSSSARAPASMFDSLAQVSWGMPKPRMAVLGVLLPSERPSRIGRVDPDLGQRELEDAGDGLLQQERVLDAAPHGYATVLRRRHEPVRLDGELGD